jgi:hypothetical protein
MTISRIEFTSEPALAAAMARRARAARRLSAEDPDDEMMRVKAPQACAARRRAQFLRWHF